MQCVKSLVMWCWTDAAVAVKCSHGLNRKTGADLVSMEGKTDENGEFKVELPRSIISSILLSYSADHNSTLKGYCSARLLSNPPEKCNVPFPVTSSSDLLTLKSDCHGIRTFTFPSLSYRSQSKLCSHSDATCSSGHKSLPAGRVLHELSKESSSGMDFSFPHTIFPPLPKPVFGFPPLNLPHPQPNPRLPPLHLPQPVLGFPPLHLPQPVLGFPPLPAGTPIPGPSLFG